MQVETIVLEVRMVALGLARVVVSPQLGDKVGGILGSIDCQSLRDHQQGLGKLGNRQLFSVKKSQFESDLDHQSLFVTTNLEDRVVAKFSR